MPSVRELDSAASPMHFFGAEVRRARQAAGMTLADLAALVPCDASTVSRIEAGMLSPQDRFAVACDEAFPHMAVLVRAVLPGFPDVGRSVPAMVRRLAGSRA